MEIVSIRHLKIDKKSAIKNLLDLQLRNQSTTYLRTYFEAGACCILRMVLVVFLHFNIQIHGLPAFCPCQDAAMGAGQQKKFRFHVRDNLKRQNA